MKSDLSNFAVPLNYTYPQQLQLIYDIAPGVSTGIWPVFRCAHEEWDGFGNVFFASPGRHTESRLGSVSST